MSETYCGKSCAQCTQKEALNCPGCKVGPGRQLGGECELALCCRGKGYEASILGNWLWILFWLIVPSTITGIMGNEYMMNTAPGIYMTGQFLNSVCSVAYGAILYRLSTEENRYRIAGICVLVSAIANVFVVIISGAAKAPTWSLLITLPMVIVALVGEYNEYVAHSLVLMEVDSELSEKWRTLWRRYISCMLALYGSIVLMLIFPLLGAIVMLGATIGILVVRIMKLIYLYRTAKVFRIIRTNLIK